MNNREKENGVKSNKRESIANKNKISNMTLKNDSLFFSFHSFLVHVSIFICFVASSRALCFHMIVVVHGPTTIKHEIKSISIIKLMESVKFAEFVFIFSFYIYLCEHKVTVEKSQLEITNCIMTIY